MRSFYENFLQLLINTLCHVIQRGQIFQIVQIDAGVLPPLFSLIDLMKDPYPGHYYKEQLTKAPKPDFKKDFFFVEKVLSEKKIKGKKYFLVKYLYYPSKYNQFVPEENLKLGKKL